MTEPWNDGGLTLEVLHELLLRIEDKLDARLQGSITGDLIANDQRWADLEVGL